MPWSARRPWLCRSTTSAVALLLANAGCSDESCGPSGDETGIVLAAGGDTASFASFSASPNNDCPNPGSPTAITVAANQTTSTGSIVLCLSRPEAVGGSEALSEDGVVQAIGLAGTLENSRCTVVAPAGADFSNLTARFDGFCDNGADAAGFSLSIAGDLEMTRTCGADVDTVTVMFSGASAVVAENF